MKPAIIFPDTLISALVSDFYSNDSYPDNVFLFTNSLFVISPSEPFSSFCRRTEYHDISFLSKYRHSPYFISVSDDKKTIFSCTLKLNGTDLDYVVSMETEGIGDTLKKIIFLTPQKGDGKLFILTSQPYAS